MAGSGQSSAKAKSGRSTERAAYLGEMDDYCLGKPIKDLTDVFPGMKIEATDKHGERYVAKVLKLNKKDCGVHIHYQNWSSRYDEFITLMSGRLFFFK